MNRSKRQILFSPIHKTPYTDDMYSTVTHVQRVFGDKNVINFFMFLSDLIFSKSEKTYLQNPTADLDKYPLQENPLVFARKIQNQRSSKFFAEVATAGVESLMLAVTF